MATAIKSKTVDFKIKSPVNFQLFLKRFKPVSKTLLLEVHDGYLQAKGFDPQDRSIIKHSRMSFSDVLEPKSTVPELLKIGIFDITKIDKLFSHFNDADELFLKIKYETVGGDNVATELLFFNSVLKIKAMATDVMTLNYLSDEMVERLLKNIDSQKMVDFPFPKDAFSKLTSLCSIDDGKDYLSLKTVDSKIVMSSKSFEYTVCDAPSGANVNFSFYNEHMGLIEQEISTFVVAPDAMLVKSQESDTFVIIGRVS